MDDKEFSDLLKKLFTPLLLCLGTFGNIISITIFTKESMKKYSTFRYLTLLSIIDLCTLYVGCGQIFFGVFFDIDIRTLNVFFCRIDSFLVYFFTHFSSILLAAMSIDRTLAIMSKRLQIMSTPKLAVKIFFILASLLALMNCHFLLFSNLIDFEVPTDNSNNLANQSTKILTICYAEIETFYFIYISQVFPWLVVISL